jgi:hypothetical protein
MLLVSNEVDENAIPAFAMVLGSPPVIAGLPASLCSSGGSSPLFFTIRSALNSQD